MRRAVLCFFASVFAYAALLPAVAAHLKNRPVEEKLGYIPSHAVLRLMSADFPQFTAASLMLKVLMYFGGLPAPNQTASGQRPDYPGMEQLLTSITRLDPYNVDAYYFAQAILTWDAGRAAEVNRLLAHGMEYRTWDHFLPFFAGFNASYFLKDYEAAARYYRKAADLSGAELFTKLASRYLYETNQTDLALIYLETMVKSAGSEAVQRSLALRLAALKAVREIEKARARYCVAEGECPDSVEALVKKGYLDHLPVDPYGGTFFIDVQGRVRTTSKLAASGAAGEGQ